MRESTSTHQTIKHSENRNSVVFFTRDRDQKIWTEPSKYRHLMPMNMQCSRHFYLAELFQPFAFTCFLNKNGKLKVSSNPFDHVYLMPG